MHRSATETKRLAVCLFLSALLHLAVVLLTPSTPDPQPALQVVFRPPPRTLETRAFDPTKPALHERQMQRLVVEAAIPQLAQDPAESAPLGEIAEQLPPEVRDDMAHLEKRMQIERSGDVNIDSLLLAHMAAEENFREDYARFPLYNTGADRDRALEVVERAIKAMGGRKRLLAIREMSAMVWIEANLKELERGGVVLTVIPVPPLAAMRHRGEEVRWHFVDRFMGEGVALDYLGQERSRDGTCYDVLLVDDRKFGHYFEALFDCRTSLLTVTREKLTPNEEQWFRRTKSKSKPPTWITVYDRYQEVQGVLTPHRWKRTLRRTTLSVYLQWAYNGAELSTAEPVLR